MITFLTFFVGLVFGVQNVEISVADSVARVELLLDGSVVASSSGPPWRFRVDFGRQIRPTVLEAVALDLDGNPIDRDVRWINLPEARADAAIVPEFDGAGRTVAATLTWESPEFAKPRQLKVRLDGEPVSVRPPYRIDLSRAPLDELHVLDVEFEFSPELSLRRQLAFGKGFSGSTTSGLTAVPVSLDDVEELPPVEQLTDWLMVAGQDVRVTASERDGARLVIVRDPSAEDTLLELYAERRKQAKLARRRGAARGLDVLDEDVEIRVLVPEPVMAEGRRSPTFLFPYSKKGHPGAEGILKAALAPRNDRMLGVGLMLPDAVAMAGLHAAEGNKRRAVLLILGREREDAQRFNPDVAREFLRDLRVPLVVWDLSGPAGPASDAWRSDRVIDDFAELARANRQLGHLLEEQRILWVGGRYLPQAFTLGPSARGISLVE